jgi:epoxyqueuosine reductase
MILEKVYKEEIKEVEEDNYAILKEIACNSEAAAFGVGYIDDLRPKFDNLTLDMTEGLVYGVSAGMRVSSAVLRGVLVGPTRHYLHHYKMINMLLDQTALKISNKIQAMGYRAMPVAASQLVDWKNQLAHLSHKMIAVRAGIGWIGRNNLLVHPECGSMIRLVTVLTDMPLKTDVPCEPGCGTCRKCIKVCPVSAIGSTYKEWDKIACLEKLKYFSKTFNIGQYICGLCVKVCDGTTTEG